MRRGENKSGLVDDKSTSVLRWLRIRLVAGSQMDDSFLGLSNKCDESDGRDGHEHPLSSEERSWTLGGYSSIGPFEITNMLKLETFLWNRGAEGVAARSSIATLLNCLL